MAITPLPPAPLPTDSTAQFNTKAFAFVASLDGFVTDANATATAVNTSENNAANRAIASAASAAASANSAASSFSFVAQSEFFADNAETSATSAAVSASAAQSAAGLPALIGNNGYVLKVNDDASGVSWQPSETFGAAETFVLSM
jgi:hypothetical protein